IDGTPIFDRLLDEDAEDGFFGIEIQDHARSEQAYLTNTAVLSTRLWNEAGDGLEITDFAPRFELFGRMHRPTTLVRIVTPIVGQPRIRVRLRPRFDWGATRPTMNRGSHHLRYADDGFAIRATTDAPLLYVIEETAFRL